MFTLLAVGTVAFVWLMPISILIVGLLFLVTFSYRQTIRAYPQGGGSYIVARANLGVLPGLVAAAALLTDYVLTVSVSVSSGVFNFASAFPALQDYTVPIIVALILLVMAVNLRGISESGSLFALPTYVFIASVILLVAVGVGRTLAGEPPPGHRRRADRGAGRDPQPAPAHARVRGRLQRDDGHRGHLQRDAGVQAARVEERPDHDGRDGGHPGHRVPRDQLPRRRLRRGPERARVRPVADRGGDVRRHPDLLRPDLRDDGDPRPRGADELRRLPEARVDPRPRPVHAPPVRLPGRAPRVQLRDHRPRGDRHRRRHRVQGARGGVDPAVRDRGVHGLHAVAGGHGPALAVRSRAGLAAERDHQRASARSRPASWPSCSRSPSSRAAPGS